MTFAHSRKRLSLIHIFSSSDLVKELEIGLAKEKDYVILRAAEDVTAFLHEDDDIDAIFSKTISVREGITAPVEAGDVLGTMTIMRGSEVYALSLIHI